MWDRRRHVFARIYRGVLEEEYGSVAGKKQVERVARVFDIGTIDVKSVKHMRVNQNAIGTPHVTTGDTICATDGEEVARIH